MTTTMHFGPEWMRTKQSTSLRPQAAPSPPLPQTSTNTLPGPASASSGAASYSALLTPNPPPAQVKRDVTLPFKFSKEDMLQVYRESSARNYLPIEVARWEGVVREEALDPASMRELTELEKKLFSGPLNSEVRRRQVSDFGAQGDRSKLSSHGIGLPNRRRRGDSTGGEDISLSITRKTSWNTVSGSLPSPGIQTNRTRLGGGPPSAGAFDGVLNGGDHSWGGRKRGPSSAWQTKPELSEEETSHAVKEEETQGPKGNKSDVHSNVSSTETSNTPSTTHESGEDSLANSMRSLSVDTRQGGECVNGAFENPSKDPGHAGVDITNLATLQWSYLDPMGNVQGPFPGETMQTWHEQGYFTDDLRMKRTHVDTDFMTLADIKRRSQGERVFLSPLADIVSPPGLSRFLPRHGQLLDSPRQPIPQPFGRNVTLESYLANASTASASPVSSFGGSFAGQSVSPDPLAVSGRFVGQHVFGESPRADRTNHGVFPTDGSPSMSQLNARVMYTDSTGEQLPAMRSGIQIVRSTSYDIHNNGNGPLQNVPWSAPLVNGAHPWDSRSAVLNGPISHPQEGQFTSSIGHIQNDPFLTPAGQPQGIYDPSRGQINFNDRFIPQPDNNDFVHSQQNGPDMGINYSGMIQQSVSDVAYKRDFIDPSLGMTPTHGLGVANQGQMNSQMRHTPPHSPWENRNQEQLMRPRPFEHEHPTANNTFVVSSTGNAQRSAWPRVVEDGVNEAQPSMWTSGPQMIPVETPLRLTEEPQSYSQMNQGPRTEQSAIVRDVSNVIERTAVPPSITEEPREKEAALAKEAQTTIKTHRELNTTKRKASTAAPIVDTPQQSLVESVLKPSALSPVASTTKAPWSIDEDAKTKPGPPPMSLREIQEAERKRQEARKAAEKERERVARTASAAAASTLSDEVQFTASWGLPSGQAGSRANSIVQVKETVPASSPPSAASPVWTNAAKPVAKTLKEIQEEEERRKALAAKERESVATAAKRAQAAQKNVLVTPQAIGGAWTVVGATGKTASAVAATRPTVVTQTSAPVIVGATSPARPTTTPVVRASSTHQAAKPPQSLKADDEPSAPSPDFVKWMRESLRGLNNTVQFEEIAAMLLSFPLDPDSSTLEIIAETVYGASTTLDGRRFANEFVAKRKTDVAGRLKGAPGLTNTRPTSLADVVKAQPKAAPEFNGYKVVKKKGKGSRT